MTDIYAVPSTVLMLESPAECVKTRTCLEGVDISPFAIVILDLTIPSGMGGKETAKGLLHIDPEARIIVSSGYADDPVMANYAEYGFKGGATKPYSLNQLSGVLAQAMEKG